MSKKDIGLVVAKVTGVLLLLSYSDNYSIIHRINDLINLYGYPGAIVFILVWIACVSSLLVITFLPNIRIKALFTCIIFSTTLLGASFANVSGLPLLYDNLYVLLENTDFTGSALSNYSNEILYGVLIALLSFTILLPPPRWVKKVWSSSGVLAAHRINYVPITAYLIILAPFAAIFLVALLRGGYGVQETPVQYRLSSLISVVALENTVYRESNTNNVEIGVNKHPDPVNIVLIVDESLRGDFLDINGNNRGITPSLFSHKDRLVNFGYASSGANCSADANQIIRFGANLHDFETTFRTNPYIWQYAKAAGYRTIMIEGQARPGSLNNRMTKKETSYIDEFIYAEGQGSRERDLDIADTIKKVVASDNKPYFILAVKSGIHFPYEDKVPEKERKYQSISVGYDVGNKTDLVNAYRNAILYITDPFFESLLSNMEYNNTVVFYTSDHGQNLLDNGSKQTHCSTNNASPYEGLVPLLVITDNDYFKEKFESAALKNFDKASHFNIVPTILNIFGFEKEGVARRHGLSLFDDINEPRRFISGVLRRNKLGLGNRNVLRWNYLPETLISQNTQNKEALSSTLLKGT
ncbi:MAG: sulfatase-like hydrolase/transferase [Pseudomonadota bacterium]